MIYDLNEQNPYEVCLEALTKTSLDDVYSTVKNYSTTLIPAVTIDDIEKQNSSKMGKLSAIISKIISTANDNRYRRYMRIPDEINSLYKSIKDMTDEVNSKYRFKMRASIKSSIRNICMESSEKKKYRYTYPTIAAPVDQIHKMIMTSINDTNKNINNDVYIYNDWKYLKEDIGAFLSKYYLYIFKNAPSYFVSISGEFVLYEYIDALYQYANNLLSISANIVQSMSTTNLYFGYTKKSEFEIEKAFNNINPKFKDVVSKTIEEIYKMCLSYSLQGLKFGYDSLDICNKLMSEYKVELEAIKNYLEGEG